MSNNNNSNLLFLNLFLVFTGLFGSSPLAAAEFDAEFRAGYITTDNILLAPTDEIDENIWTGGLTLDLAEESSRITTDIHVVADYLDYDQSFESEWIGGINALIDFTLIDEHLNWVIRENFGQRLVNVFETPNPGNRENVNYFTTGPDLRFPIGGQNFIGLEGRYSTVRYRYGLAD